MHEFAPRAPAFADRRPNVMALQDAARRTSARIADKYAAPDGAPLGRAPTEVRRRQAEEVAELESALEHVRRGLGAGRYGAAGRIALRTIEAVLERDYGLYARIKPDNR